MPEHDSSDSNSFRKRFDFFIFIGLMISATMFIKRVQSSGISDC